MSGSVELTTFNSTSSTSSPSSASENDSGSTGRKGWYILLGLIILGGIIALVIYLVAKSSSTPVSSPTTTDTTSESSSTTTTGTTISSTPSVTPSKTPVITFIPTGMPTKEPYKICYSPEVGAPITATASPENPIWRVFSDTTHPMQLISIFNSSWLYSLSSEVVEELDGTYMNTETGSTGKVFLIVRRDLGDCSYPSVIGAVFDNDPQHNFGPACFHSMLPNREIWATIKELFNTAFPTFSFMNIYTYKPIDLYTVQLTVNYFGPNGWGDERRGDIIVKQNGNCQNLSIVSTIGNWIWSENATTPVPVPTGRY